MNKKIMALAVAGAFAAPAAALAQASNVQIFGTVYIEYAYAKQGSQNPPGSGDLVNIDFLQTPGSEIGFKGEEALGGGTSAWFQCTSTMDFRGAAPQGFCGRNSALGVKGNFGNLFAGNWDMPTKRTAGAVRILSDTGVWGTGFLLFNNSSTFNDNGGPAAFSRRQNNSIFYDTPVWGGFQGFVGVSTPSTAIARTSNYSGAKPRVWSVAANYTNGPLIVTAGYERHNNFATGAGAGAGLTTNNQYASEDTGYQIGAAYQFGPVKVGLLYANQRIDTSQTQAVQSDLRVSAWNLGAEWRIVGPHGIRGGYTKANDTKGNYGPGTAGASVAGAVCAPIAVPVNGNGAALAGAGSGQRIGNCGAGGTGANLWQIQYVYQASKRTEFTVGYARLDNDNNARYSLGGFTQPNAGQDQNAFAVSMKTTF